MGNRGALVGILMLAGAVFAMMGVVGVLVVLMLREPPAPVIAATQGPVTPAGAPVAPVPVIAPAPVAEPIAPTVPVEPLRPAVAAIVRAHRRDIQRCYERGLRAHPGLTGEVSLLIVVGADGRPAGVSVESSTLGDAEVESCLTGEATGWRFPRPDGAGATLHVPIVLTAG